MRHYIFKGVDMGDSEKELIDQMKKFFNVSSLEDVAENLGYSRASANNWRNRGVSDAAKMKFILAQNKNFDADLLRQSRKDKEQGALKFDIDLLREQEGPIPLRYFENVTASAGYGSQNSDKSFEPLSVSADFLKAVFGITAAKYGYDMIRIFGDSMEPFVKNGDIIFVDRQKEIMSGDVVIAEVGEDTFIKKFLRDSVHKSIKLTSLSDFYQDIVLKDDEIENLKLLGKIVCKFSINIKVF